MWQIQQEGVVRHEGCCTRLGDGVHEHAHRVRYRLICLHVGHGNDFTVSGNGDCLKKFAEDLGQSTSSRSEERVAQTTTF